MRRDRRRSRTSRASLEAELDLLLARALAQLTDLRQDQAAMELAIGELVRRKLCLLGEVPDEVVALPRCPVSNEVGARILSIALPIDM